MGASEDGDPQVQAGCGLHPGVCDGRLAAGTMHTKAIPSVMPHCAAKLKGYVGQSANCFVGKPTNWLGAATRQDLLQADGASPSLFCYIPSPQVIFVQVSKYFRLTILMASCAWYQPTKGSKACWCLLYLPCSRYYPGPHPPDASLLGMQAGPQTLVRICRG